MERCGDRVTYDVEGAPEPVELGPCILWEGHDEDLHWDGSNWWGVVKAMEPKENLDGSLP